MDMLDRAIRPLDVLLCAGTTLVAPRFDQPDKVVSFTAQSRCSASTNAAIGPLPVPSMRRSAPSTVTVAERRRSPGRGSGSIV